MKRILLMTVISILGLTFQSLAQGDLMITPKRVVFDGNKQNEILNIVNLGKDKATFSISFVQKEMKEDGSFMTIEKKDSRQMLAEPYLRIFPRKITLEPGKPQAIMLQCRRTSDMIAGEYRSHIYFRSEKDYQPLGTKNNDAAVLSVQLIPIYGITIPIIIRTGTVNASASLSDLKLGIQQETIQDLSLTINRSGNISLYGDIIVDHIPAQGKQYQIGIFKSVAIYTNLNKRNVVVKLNNNSGKSLRDGKLKVKYISKDENKPVVYAEAELDLK